MIDVFIVGQGIAGSCLAYALMKQGYSVALMDNQHQLSSSYVAAGLMQHISGKFLTLNDFLNHCFSSATSFYHEIETRFSCSFTTSLNTYRLADTLQLKKWRQKKNQPRYQPYLSDTLLSCSLPNKVLSPCIGLVDTMVIHTAHCLHSFHHYFLSRHCLFLEPFSEKYLTISSDFIRYKHILARSIIFCTGAQSHQLSFFSDIPLHSIKGETMLFSTPDLLPDRVIQQNYWIVPYEKSLFKIGGNYDPSMLTAPTQQTTQLLLSFLAKCGVLDYTALHHMSGFRCFLSDQFPICGFLPHHPRIGLFSGLGSKGFITAPALADAWALSFWDEKELPEEVGLKRFF